MTGRGLCVRGNETVAGQSPPAQTVAAARASGKFAWRPPHGSLIVAVLPFSEH